MPNDFLDNLQLYQQEADSRLASFFDQRQTSSVESLDDVSALEDFVLRKSKRLRGYLCCLGYRLFDDSLPEEVINFSLGFELGHAGLLIQDDIFDQGRLRRGQKAFHLTQGIKRSILLSNILVNYSCQAFLQAKLDSQLKVKALKYLNRQAIMTGMGELLDLDLASSDKVSLEKVRSISELKTASYTTKAPLVMGAILAGSKRKEQQELEVIAARLGILFQALDDYLDYFGNSQELGKDTGSDQKLQKQSYVASLEASQIEFQQSIAAEKDDIEAMIKKTAWPLKDELLALLNYLIKRKT
ncbi:polyprenyl synthetase family protein [Patescibacteria group bacterium]|nr:polyprenyl synthetase family protein [Patescibacteria group bacterium]